MLKVFAGIAGVALALALTACAEAPQRTVPATSEQWGQAGEARRKM